MQNGIYEEGLLEFPNRFSMNLTKVLFVAFIFLFALSFAAAAVADNAGQESGEQQLAIHSQTLAIPLVRYGVLFLWACSGLVVVYPKSGAMAWIMTKLPALQFEVPLKASEYIKKGYLYQLFEWFYVFSKGGYSLFLEGLFLGTGVFLSTANPQAITKGCTYIVVEYGILAILFVWIEISSYLKWEVPITFIKEGNRVSKTVKISDHVLRVYIFMFVFSRLVRRGLISLDANKECLLNSFQQSLFPIWRVVMVELTITYAMMLYQTIIYHHPVVDTIATIIVFIGIYAPLLLVIEDIVRVIILPRILGLSSYLVKSRGSNPNHLDLNPGLNRVKTHVL